MAGLELATKNWNIQSLSVAAVAELELSVEQSSIVSAVAVGRMGLARMSFLWVQEQSVYLVVAGLEEQKAEYPELVHIGC